MPAMREGAVPVGRLICELRQIVDLDNESAISDALLRRVNSSSEPVVVVEVSAAMMTSNGLRVLMRLRAVLAARGRVLWVVARRPAVRRVFRVCRLDRTLRVVATTAAVRDGCVAAHLPGAGGEPPGRAPRDQGRRSHRPSHPHRVRRRTRAAIRALRGRQGG